MFFLLATCSARSIFGYILEDWSVTKFKTRCLSTYEVLEKEKMALSLYLTLIIIVININLFQSLDVDDKSCANATSVSSLCANIQETPTIDYGPPPPPPGSSGGSLGPRDKGRVEKVKFLCMCLIHKQHFFSLYIDVYWFQVVVFPIYCKYDKVNMDKGGYLTNWKSTRLTDHSVKTNTSCSYVWSNTISNIIKSIYQKEGYCLCKLTFHWHQLVPLAVKQV